MFCTFVASSPLLEKLTILLLFTATDLVLCGAIVLWSFVVRMKCNFLIYDKIVINGMYAYLPSNHDSPIILWSLLIDVATVKVWFMAVIRFNSCVIWIFCLGPYFLGSWDIHCSISTVNSTNYTVIISCKSAVTDFQKMRTYLYSKFSCISEIFQENYTKSQCVISCFNRYLMIIFKVVF